jgi:hypothetical protein
MRKNLLLFPVLLLLGGCLPIPHTDYYAPKINGVVTVDGVALSDSKVYLENPRTASYCASDPLITRTNENGEFKIGPITGFNYIVMFYGDPYVEWNLCVEHEGKMNKILHMYGRYSPEQLSVYCNLSFEDEFIHESVGYNLYGKCRDK